MCGQRQKSFQVPAQPKAQVRFPPGAWAIITSKQCAAFLGSGNIWTVGNWRTPIVWGCHCSGCYRWCFSCPRCCCCSKWCSSEHKEWGEPTVWVENWADAARLLLSIVGYEWHWHWHWQWLWKWLPLLDNLTDCNIPGEECACMPVCLCVWVTF